MPEVIAAVHCGYEEIACVSCITDMCVWDSSSDPTIEQCLAVANETAPRLKNIFVKFLENRAARK